MGMLRHAEEQGALIEFLEWKLDEGLELSDEMSSHYFRIEHVPRFEITCLALALLAKEDPEKAIRWAANHTMKFDFDWRATIVSGWIEYNPPDRESIPKFESKHEDSLNWLLRTVEAGNRGLTSAFYQWYYDQDIEALRWLAEPAVGPPEEEVKAALRAEFLK